LDDIEALLGVMALLALFPVDAFTLVLSFSACCSLPCNSSTFDCKSAGFERIFLCAQLRRFSLLVTSALLDAGDFFLEMEKMKPYPSRAHLRPIVVRLLVWKLQSDF